MLIDWFTVGAQILNFFILVWLMKRFLYKPILHAIDEREKKIAAQIADAAAKASDAKKEQEEFQLKNDEFDKQRSALINKATEEASSQHRQLLDEARKAADELSAKRQEILSNELHQLSQAIRHLTHQEVFAISRKVLKDLAATSLEECICEIFMRRLKELTGKMKDDLSQALRKASAPALVRSAFDMPQKQRTAIQNTLNGIFSSDIHIGFETAPNLISGIELIADGQKIAWSIADYLSSLEKKMDTVIKVKPNREEIKSQSKN